MGLTPLLKMHSILPLLLILNLGDSSSSSSSKNKVRIFFLKAEINQLLSLIIFLCELSAMPLILIINIDLLCYSNLDLVLCLKLWKIRRSFLFFLFFELIMFDMLVIVAIPA